MSCEVVEKDSVNGCVDNLRMQIKNAECAKIGDRLSRMVTEMMAAQGEIVGLESQLAAAEEAKAGALAQVGEIQTALRKEMLKSEELERKVEEKDAVVERLKELNVTCEKIASESIAELKKTKEAVELVSLLETEVKQLKAELEEIRTEGAHSKDRVLEAQVENALLKVELHKWRSKAAAAEAAEERSKRHKLALPLAVKTESNSATISRKEYEVLMKKADEQGKLERELMTATRKMREFRTRAEQAISRAEAAEKGKAQLREKIKRIEEEKKKKREFYEILKEQINSTSPDVELKNTPAIQTLSNVLEIPL